MFALHSLSDNEGELVEGMDGFMSVKLPNTLSVTSEVFESDGIYLLDDTTYLWLYIGRNVPSQDLEEWFGLPANSYDRPRHVTFQRGSEYAMRMQAIVETLREQNSIKQGQAKPSEILLLLLFFII